MIKVSIMYPFAPGARFDHEYYRDKHMPLVKSLLGKGCQSYTIDKGVSGGAAGSAPIYVGMCHIFSESIEAFQAASGPHQAEIAIDIAVYTDIKPIVQISEVVEIEFGRG